jgi:hypothetical protein
LSHAANRVNRECRPESVIGVGSGDLLGGMALITNGLRVNQPEKLVPGSGRNRHLIGSIDHVD